MDGIFITGTDTGVGKTTLSAGLLAMLHGHNNARYWKPVQTGTVLGDDTKEVMELASVSEKHVATPAYRFPMPVAPWVAAEQQKAIIDFEKLVAAGKKELAQSFTIIEGAGGLMVPLTDGKLIGDLNREWKLPVIIVAENRLGTINHTLMTLATARSSGFDVLGVVLTKCTSNDSEKNAECINRFGDVRIIASLPHRQDKRHCVGDINCDDNLRQLFGLARLP